MTETLVKLNDVKVHFPVGGGLLFKGDQGLARAVDGVSLEIPRGKTIGLVGESGCGKSTLARAVMQLVPVTSGEVWFKDKNLTSMSKRDLRNERRHFQMIFQDPFASLNPRLTVGDIVAEPLKTHGVAKGQELREQVQELLQRVGLNPRYIRRFPHEFSGGQRQRIGIARALALCPELIVADEPVSALDVSIQAQILNLLVELKEQFNLTYLFIAHDLAAVRHVSDYIAVMYLGKIVEYAPVDEIYSNPQHPYTKALLGASPIPDPIAERKRQQEWQSLQGDVPSPLNPPQGCSFNTRCPQASDRCRQDEPTLREYSTGHHTSCHLMNA